jgi:cysteinyl-tRNA synthetase
MEQWLYLPYGDRKTHHRLMTLYLYNTLTRRPEHFEPMEPPKVRIYYCGVAVG